MSFLYRVALMVTRKQSYIDWANGGSDDAPELTADLANETRTVYLAPESDGPPDRDAVLDEFWVDLFEAELAAWNSDEAQWPQPLTREMFDAWFDVELTGTVFDLTPEEPLSQRDVDLDEVADALAHCAWCGLEVDAEPDRFVAFALSDRSRLAHREGRTVPLIAGDGTVIVGVMTIADSDEAKAGDDLLFRVCTTRCEKAILKAVPKALRKLSIAATVDGVR